MPDWRCGIANISTWIQEFRCSGYIPMFPELKAHSHLFDINIDIELRGLLPWFPLWFRIHPLFGIRSVPRFGRRRPKRLCCGSRRWKSDGNGTWRFWFRSCHATGARSMKFFHWILDAGCYWVMRIGWYATPIGCLRCVLLCYWISYDFMRWHWLYIAVRNLRKCHRLRQQKQETTWVFDLKRVSEDSKPPSERQFPGAIWTAPTLGTKGEGTARTGTRTGATWQRLGSKS